ncbi:alpha/beta hydrolase [Flavobacterium sp.]|uniref:alpha/beta hydrolase family protein n=1 Tax=Flavobacterium sp. TaxID=239 RepID=UPI00260289C9|nr:alpha/beta hydrolase [Flavobacterium sp.]MDD3003640.1 alpha/beta hydrolase [Flavobacterium sp.]
MLKKILFLWLLVSFSSHSVGQDISGSWTGILEIQGSELPLILNFTSSNGGYKGTMDSPKQGAKEIPIDEVSFNNKQLTVKINAFAIEYIGEWKSNTEILGTFKQGNFSAPMHLKKGSFEIKKPQNPIEPYPYHTEKVEFKNTKENISLAGTLSLPKKEGKFPAVILISGSGQQNRDSEILGHKPFLVISDYLTRNGIAVLRYDDRGVGQSKGDPTHSTSADFANDAAGAIEYLRSRKEIDSKKIGVIGHSEGGMIAPMLSANDKNIAFIILLAGPGVSGDVLLLDQNYEVGKKQGLSENDLQEAKILNQKIYNIIKSEKDLAEMKKSLTAVLQTEMEKLPEAERPSKNEIEKSINEQVDGMTVPWLRYFISYDPHENLKKTKCPVLVLNGEKDIQVTAKLNTEAITKALHEGKNKNVQVQIFPNLNHLFQHCTACNVAEYSQIEETFSSEVLKTMSDWIHKQIK